uniref:STARD3 N-terminal like n=1 Tax=Fundulus heteroclitus TaxID=8078 RepID=A0A3Q2NWL5_FUNHE
MDSRCSSMDSRASGRGMGSVSSTPQSARVESYEAVEKKCISDVRRTFCLFVTFDLLFVTLLWIIELNINGGVQAQLEKEVLHYDYHASFFDIFLLAVFRFAALILAYAICKLRHWWAIAITTALSCAFLIIKVILSKLLSQGPLGYLLPIVSFVLAWLETWLLDFKVLPQEAEDENSESTIWEEVLPLTGFKNVLLRPMFLPSCSQDISRLWTPLSALHSWVLVLYPTGSSTLRRSLWQVSFLPTITFTSSSSGQMTKSQHRLLL